jgi:hypothetical protein
MPVIFKGGTSGDAHDYTSGTPSSGASQPVLDTSNSTDQPGVKWGFPASNPGNTDSDGKFDPQVPTGGAIPEGSTDVQEQGLPNPGPNANPTNIFRGAPDTGNQ